MSLFGQPPRILIADDDRDICLYLKRYLERRKYHVSAAFGGQEAKVLIEKEAFDFLLLDCSMPELTGLELIEMGRRRNPDAKIVLISAFPSINNDVIKKLGGDAFIHKPIQLSEIDEIFYKNKEALNKE
jgi:two-component system, NtrC family, response regulator HydG